MWDSPAGRSAWPRPGGAISALRRFLALILVAGALLGFTGDGQAQGPYGANDPLEDFNRAVFEFNQTIDRFILKPVAEIYVFVLPEEARHRITNVLRNLGEPLNLVNNLAQGKFERAGSTLTRFTINSTIGVGGIFDVATDWGYQRTSEDFGQTLASWGLGDRPFLMLPLLGPSNPRDAVGFGVDMVADPMGYLLTDNAGLARSITSGVSQRAAYLDELETVESTSVDFYAALRELYLQYRATEIRDGAPPTVMEIPDFDFDEDFDDEWFEE